jgi:hypothetical protein
MNDILERIAQQILDIDTLKIQGSDSLDFHEVNVLSIREALSQAFLEGQATRVAA